MKLTALDVRNRRFRTRWLGYDPYAVQTFLEAAADAMEELARSNLHLQDRLTDARARVDELKGKENQVREVLLTARQAAEESLSAAQRQCEARMAEARAGAESIIAAARVERVDLVEEVARLRHQRDRFRSELKALLDAHQTLLGGQEPTEDDLDGSDNDLERSGQPVVFELGEPRDDEAEPPDDDAELPEDEEELPADEAEEESPELRLVSEEAAD